MFLLYLASLNIQVYIYTEWIANRDLNYFIVCINGYNGFLTQLDSGFQESLLLQTEILSLGDKTLKFITQQIQLFYKCNVVRERKVWERSVLKIELNKDNVYFCFSFSFDVHIKNRSA